MALQTLFRNDAVAVLDYRCSAGPEDKPYVELHGSHFIAMEKPDRVHELLLELLSRVEATG